MKTLKKFFENNRIEIIIILLTVLCLTSVYFLYKERAEYNSEVNRIVKIHENKTKELEAQIEKKSDIEILQERAVEAHRYSNVKLAEINALKEAIKAMEFEYEYAILDKKCSKDQIERMNNDLEYNIEYCDVKENLDQYRTKKY